MDYEKKYKEALEKARKLCAYPTSEPIISDLQDLFPELKESEGERIRKELIDYFKENNAALAFKGISNERVIAWLEKQGQTFTKKDVDDAYLRGISDAKHEIEKQGEQKHQYNSRPRYVGEEKLLGTNKQGKCPFSKQELIDMGFAFTQDGDLAYPIHKIENKEFAAWKPSDAQIQALWELMRYAPSLSVYTKIQESIESLYNDLKKLRKE